MTRSNIRFMSFAALFSGAAALQGCVAVPVAGALAAASAAGGAAVGAAGAVGAAAIGAAGAAAGAAVGGVAAGAGALAASATGAATAAGATAAGAVGAAGGATTVAGGGAAAAGGASLIGSGSGATSVGSGAVSSAGAAPAPAAPAAQPAGFSPGAQTPGATTASTGNPGPTARAGQSAGGARTTGPQQGNARARTNLPRGSLRMIDDAAEAARSCLTSMGDLNTASSALASAGWNIEQRAAGASQADRDGVAMVVNPGALLCLVQADDMRLAAAQAAGEQALKQAFGIELQLSDFAPSGGGCGGVLLEGPKGPMEMIFSMAASSSCAPDSRGVVMIRQAAGGA